MLQPTSPDLYIAKIMVDANQTLMFPGQYSDKGREE